MDPKLLSQLKELLEMKEGTSSGSSSPKRNTTSWRDKTTDKKGPKKAGIPKTNVGKPVVNPNPPTKIPPGQYLSKTSTELSNDPLSEKAYFPGPSSYFQPTATKEKIYSGASVLPLLQEETYTQVCSLNPSYAKTVPKCAHDYYLGVLTFARLLRLHIRGGGRTTPEEGLFLSQIEEFSFTVPKSVSLFLSGFGNTKIPSGRDVHFAMLKPDLFDGAVTLGGENVVNIPGYFGEIEENLGTYSSYPCLGVYAQKILQDLVHPPAQPLAQDWDLPEGLRFLNRPINRNCLGYTPSVRLSQEQRAFLSGARVTEDQFEFDSDELPIMYELLTAVQMKLSATRITLFPITVANTGSVGQLPVEQIDRQNGHTLVRASFTSETSFDLPATEGYLGSSFLYNVNKTSEELRFVKSIMPVRYRINDAVPVAARENLGILYSSSTDLVKQHGYETTSFSPGLRIGEVVKFDSVQQ